MTVVKICGITNIADAEAAVEAGADALGFNFWPSSPRYLPLAEAGRLLPKVPKGVLRVGVFVDTPAAEMDRIATELNLNVVQLHGTLDTKPSTTLWQAVSAGTEGWRETIEAGGAGAFLVDTPAGTIRGGTGKTFDWTLLNGITQRIVLAGGLGPENVAEAIAQARPWGVDACSQLEAAPGKKDALRMRAFIEAVRKMER